MKKRPFDMIPTCIASEKTRLDSDVERCGLIIDHNSDNNHSDVYFMYTLYMFFSVYHKGIVPCYTS